jgi:hypothetical protein
LGAVTIGGGAFSWRAGEEGKGGVRMGRKSRVFQEGALRFKGGESEHAVDAVVV